MSNQTHLTRDELLEIVKIQSRTIATLIQEKQEPTSDNTLEELEEWQNAFELERQSRLLSEQNARDLRAYIDVFNINRQRLTKKYTQQWDDRTDVAAHYEDINGWILGIDCCDHEGTIVISEGRIENLLDELIGDPTQD